jgi:hypothetical protein
VPDDTAPSEHKICYKFFSSNLRYHPVRHLIVSYLYKKSSVLSFNNDKVDFANFEVDFQSKKDKQFWNSFYNRCWFDIEAWNITNKRILETIESGASEIEKLGGRLIIDQDFSNQDTNLMHGIAVPKEQYYRCFLSVVTESFFAQPQSIYTEKTLHAIKCFRPFVLVAPPHTLSLLKQCGVKTFDKFWDESYDREENHEQRLLKILKVIDYIDSFSVDDLKQLYIDMLPILVHNHQTIATLRHQNWIK